MQVDMVASKPIFSCNYLKLYSWLGYFPCLKSNDDCEQSKLIPMSWKLQLLLYFFSSIIPVGLFCSFLIYMMISNELHFMELLAFMRGSDKKELDIGSILYLSTTLMVYLEHLILQFTTRQIKGLPKRQRRPQRTPTSSYLRFQQTPGGWGPTKTNILGGWGLLGKLGSTKGILE